MALSRQIWPAICLSAVLAGLAAHPLAAQTADELADSACCRCDRLPRRPAGRRTRRSRPTRCRPRSWPRQSRSAAFATFWIIAGSVWGIVLLWLLLARGGAAGLESWAQRIAEQALDPGGGFLRGVLCYYGAGRIAAGLDRPSLRARLRDQRAGLG